jgi:parallel beta-helix repeat protein
MDMRKKTVLIILAFSVFVMTVLAWTILNKRTSTIQSYRVHNVNTGLNYGTIQEAIDANTTLNGHTIIVKPGIFHEHIVVRKAVILEGDGEQSTILDGDGNGTVISIRSSAVVEGFTIQNGSIGIELDSSNNGRISNDGLHHNGQGLHLSNSNNWTMSENLITNNYDTCITLNNSDTNVISKNVVSYNNLHFHEALSMYNSDCNNISENDFTDNMGIGIQLNDYSFHNTVSNNLLMNNWGGIELVKSCNHNIIERNCVTVNETMWGLTSGIWIRESQQNIVYANEIMSNRTFATYKPPYEDGVGLSKSANNSVVSNKISLMDTGVGFHFSSDNNSIIGNTISKNGHGIDFSEGVSNGNVIYSNNFIENAEQVHNRLSTNTWDNGYPSGGNYWSDYVKEHPNASEIDASKIWNTPYVVDANNTDKYPLMAVTQESPRATSTLLFMTAEAPAAIIRRRYAHRRTNQTSYPLKTWRLSAPKFLFSTSQARV